LKNTSIIILLQCIVAATSCTKKQTDLPDASTVKMVVTAPESGHVYHMGDTVHFRATVIYNGIMHGYELKVTDTASSGVLFDYAEHVHKDSFLIDQFFVLTSADALVLKFNLETEVDHNGAVAEKVIYCSYQP
jgi:hypothetical protein